jgi:hypothetical protein
MQASTASARCDGAAAADAAVLALGVIGVCFYNNKKTED